MTSALMWSYGHDILRPEVPEGRMFEKSYKFVEVAVESQKNAKTK
jgi:hypothetical protein